MYKFKFFKKIYIKSFLIFVLMLSLIPILKFYNLSIKDILLKFHSLNSFQVSIIFLFYILISSFDIITRKILIFFMTNKKTKFINLCFIHFCSMATNYSTPVKIGFPVAIFLMKKKEKINYSDGTSIILIELLSIMFLTGLVSLFGTIYYLKKQISFVIISFLILCLAILATIYLSQKIQFTNQKNLKYITSITQSLKKINFTHLFFYILLRSILIFLNGLNLLILIHFFSGTLTFIQAIVATNTSFFLGAISMIPMGLGSREASMLFFLNLFSVPTNIAISVITLQRFISTGLTFIIGYFLISFSTLKYSLQNKDN
ncbi:MAG: hypothetical protein CSA18_03870 [Deltaproteobacteria bacterium]|nr:MAG: hypothetical protein CSB21_00500 [Deltaproteobacteria bacterium]PIE74696.1 MAG: hypothetical protein CSA18_03870 [Deltaproteobacteria bacterium]